MQDSSNSIANGLELLQSFAKPSIQEGPINYHNTVQYKMVKGLSIMVPCIVAQRGYEVKPASNDFGCICEQIWKDQCSIEVHITINRTK